MQVTVKPVQLRLTPANVTISRGNDPQKLTATITATVTDEDGNVVKDVNFGFEPSFSNEGARVKDLSVTGLLSTGNDGTFTFDIEAGTANEASTTLELLGWDFTVPSERVTISIIA